VKFKTVFTEAAKSDIHKAAFWYEAQSSGLGK